MQSAAVRERVNLIVAVARLLAAGDFLEVVVGVNRISYDYYAAAARAACAIGASAETAATTTAAATGIGSSILTCIRRTCSI